MAMTVPKTCKKANDDSLKERKPTMSVVMAIIKAMDVSTVPWRIARWRDSLSKSLSVTRPAGLRFSSSLSSSRIRRTTCNP